MVSHIRKIIFLSGLLAVHFAWAGAKVSSIDFRVTGGGSEITIKSDSAIQYDKVDNADDQQLVLNLKDTSLLKTASRKLDTSSFDSPVSLISPYQIQGSSDARIVIQLREPATSSVSQTGNVIHVSVASSGTPKSDSDAKSPGTPVSTDLTDAKEPDAPAADSPVDPANKAENATTPDAPPSGGKGKLDEFAESKESKRFTGRPITIQVRDAELADVFRLIGEASGFNIVMGDDVKGKISLSLVDVPWDQVLDIVLQTQKLGAERNNNVLRISTLANLTKEKQEQLGVKIATQAVAPRITRIFPISYANLTDLMTLLKNFNTANSSGLAPSGPGAPAAGAGMDTTVQMDNRTNSIIVRDTAENIEKMKKLIEILDTQTPQVLIEAKVVEASETFARQITGGVGIGQPGADAFFSGNGVTGQVSSLLGAASAQAGTSAQMGGGIRLTGISNNARLNATLSLSEVNQEIKIVSSPRVVVLNKESSNILQSTPTIFQGTTFIAGVGNVPLTQILQANLSLDVTPTVTNEGSVLMQLKISRDNPVDFPGTTNTAVANRNMTTKVLVDSGSTLVIGGIYTTTDSNTDGGVPILYKIPILGWLFGTHTKRNDKTELFIFITPRILNEKEAGLKG